MQIGPICALSSEDSQMRLVETCEILWQKIEQLVVPSMEGVDPQYPHQLQASITLSTKHV